MSEKVLVNGPGCSSSTFGYKETYYLAVGDKVTSRFHKEQSSLVRTITHIEAHPGYGSGACASADGGEPCPTCGRDETPILSVDASWFIPVFSGEDTHT
jgi:hypothetical protein